MLSGFEVIRNVLAIPNYRWYLAGNLCSTAGNWIQRVAMGWLTWQLTHSGAWLGIMAFADMFPTFLVGLTAGAIVDRTDAMKVLRFTQVAAMCQGGTLAVITFSGVVTPYLLLAFALLRGTIIAFNRPSRMTVIYQIAGRETLASVIAINSMVFNSARFVGPAVGGGVIAAWGVSWAFAINAATYVFFLVALFMIRVLKEAETAKVRERRGLLASSVEGVRYTLGNPGVFTMLLVLLLTSLFVRPFTELLPGFTSEVLDRGVNAYSALLAFHGVGAMIGGYWMAQRGGTEGFTKVLIGTLIVVALALMVFTTVAVYWLALPIMIVTGGCFVAQGIAIQTLLQTTIAPDMRGRVMSLYGMVARGGPSLGALTMGTMSEFLGLRGPLFGGAVLCFLLWVWAFARRERLTRLMEGGEGVPAGGGEQAGFTGG